MRPSFLRRPLPPSLLVLCIPALLAGKGRCRKEVEPPADEDAATVVEVADPAVELQVASVRPATLEAGIPATLHVFGAGFPEAAAVEIAGQNLSDVRRLDVNTLEVQVPGLAAGSYALTVRDPAGHRATLPAALSVVERVDDSCRHMAMYFDLDEASLSAAVREALDVALPCLARQAQVRLEGHADERGTTDYNLALGQRRAEAVAAYLVTRGLDPRKLPVISYGEERPADPGHDEEAWARNRRVELVVP